MAGALAALRSASRVLSPPVGYTLVFEDDFPGTSLDTSKWGIPHDADLVTVANSIATIRITGTSDVDKRASGFRHSDSYYLNFSDPSPLIGIQNQIKPPCWFEVIMKPANVRGVLSELIIWSEIYETPQGSGWYSFYETDLIEQRGHIPGNQACTTHYWSTDWDPLTTPGQLYDIHERTGGELWLSANHFHRYVADIDVNRTLLYVDGVLVTQRDTTEYTPVNNYPKTLAIDAYVASPGDTWAGPQGVEYPIPADTTMQIDLVRIYRQLPTPGNLLSELWQGADGAPWNASRWTTSVDSDGIIQIRSNKGYMAPGGASYAGCRAVASGVFADFDLTVDFALGNDLDQYHGLFFRASSGFAADGFDPLNGYVCMFDLIGNDHINLYEVVDGTRGPISTVERSFTAVASIWTIRIRCVGTAIKVKLWGGAEPAAWNIEIDNDTFSSGIFGFSAMNGATPTATPIWWDELAVNAP